MCRHVLVHVEVFDLFLIRSLISVRALNCGYCCFPKRQTLSVNTRMYSILYSIYRNIYTYVYIYIHVYIYTSTHSIRVNVSISKPWSKLVASKVGGVVYCMQGSGWQINLYFNIYFNTLIVTL